MNGQHKVHGVVNIFSKLRIGAPQGLEKRKPLWPQGDLISPRDLERDADLQEIYRTARQLEKALLAEQQRRHWYQSAVILTVICALGVLVFMGTPPMLQAVRAWAIATLPAPPEGQAIEQAAEAPIGSAISSVPRASLTAVIEALSRSSAIAPVSMDGAMAGVPLPDPTKDAARARPAPLPYLAPPTMTATAPRLAAAAPQQQAPQRSNKTPVLQVEPIAKVRPLSEATPQPVASEPALRAAAASTIPPRFVESAPVVQGFAGTTGVLISFGDGGAVRAYRLNDVLTPGETITAISPTTGEITTTRRTIRK